MCFFIIIIIFRLSVCLFVYRSVCAFVSLFVCITNVIFCVDGSLTKCQKQRKQALRLYNPRQFIPRCSPDGSFAPVQCRKTYCYCVTKEGQEIPGTKAKLPLRPYCNGRDPEKALRQGKTIRKCLKCV